MNDNDRRYFAVLVTYIVDVDCLNEQFKMDSSLGILLIQSLYPTLEPSSTCVNNSYFVDLGVIQETYMSLEHTIIQRSMSHTYSYMTNR